MEADMRNSLIKLLILAILSLLLSISCGGGSTGGMGDLIADFDLEGEDYLAGPDTPLDRIFALISSGTAHALPDLGFNSNSYPFNKFTGDKDAQAGVQVAITGQNLSEIATGVTGVNGRVQFSNLPLGYLNMLVTGQDGKVYHIPVHISENITSRSKVLVFRQNGQVVVNGKTIHDSDGNEQNDDDFSIALFGRPQNQSRGGSVHIHANGVTQVDGNGDGDFNDPEDYQVTEPDDDGISSDNGDGDEDNDGIIDPNDSDIDGDTIPNVQDDDIDGDGILNGSDPYPEGDSPNDDFSSPEADGGGTYQGILDLAPIDSQSISVFFQDAMDENEPVTYFIYFSTEDPIDYETAAYQMFLPTQQDSPDDVYSDNIINLVQGNTYFVSVRAQDAAQPPNMDDNTNMLSITLQ